MPRVITIVRRLLRFRMPQRDIGDQYSVWVGLVYIFNLIVGTGALTLPAVFAKAGWGLGLISIIFLAFMSFLNATYVLETMACANAVLKWKRLQNIKRECSIQEEYEESSDESTLIQKTEGEEPLVSVTQSSHYYSLNEKIELGEMADLFFNKTGRMLFYVTLIIYLYGDLSIYSAAVAKSIMDVVCTYIPPDFNNGTLPDNTTCFNHSGSLGVEGAMTRYECYRMALLTFMAALGPFVFFNVQKTKYLQMLTTLMRWLAFAIMISFAIHLLFTKGPQGKPPTFQFSGLPSLFGTCVYSFMCHHSLPGLVSPIRRKTYLGAHLALDYFVICLFYLLLAFTGAFAFANLNDLYTLNFVPTDSENIFLEIIEYFLALFPVFTLSTSFPIIAITLRNNIQGMFLDMSRLDSYNIFLRRLIFPVVSIVPPILLTLFIEDLKELVGFTGSYAGTCIQYLIPTFLVLCARRYCANLLGLGVTNKHQSYFKSILWGVFVICWSVVCVILVSVHFFERES